jgi:P27 family predicted phage terminase small subunit
MLKGNPGKRPLRPEPEPNVPAECPDPPNFLSKYAQDEWWRIAPRLHRIGLLTVVDIQAMASYCQSYSRWRESEQLLARIAKDAPSMRGLLVKSSDGNARRNPLIKIAADQLPTCCAPRPSSD